MSSHPPPSPPPSASSLEAGRAADRRRPRADLPTPPPAGPASNAEPCRCGGPGRSPARPTTCRWRRSRSRTGSSARRPSKIGLVDAARLVQEARLYFDPDRAIADEEHELARRGVWLRHRGNPATTDLVMTLDTPDALLFDQTVTRIAGELANSATPTQLDVRRARAVGILADPQYALDLMSGRDAAPTAGAGAREPVRPPRPRPARCRRPSRSSAPPPPNCSTDWLTRYAAPAARSSSDPSSTSAQKRPRSTSTTHPPRCASSACCATPTASSPAAARDSRGCDLDHITAYIPMSDGGPPGQTSPLNLAPLCRTHHRIKTFTAWDYKRLDDGTYVWTSPTGHQYEVHPTSRRPPRRT